MLVEEEKMSGFICSSPAYRYEGWLFEIHSFCGPHPLNEDLEPVDKIGIEFWVMIDGFNQLSIEEKEKCKVIDGGCQRF